MPSDIPDYLDETPQDGVLAIPYQQLSADALDGILEDFVTREGTDYGDYDYSLADKRLRCWRSCSAVKPPCCLTPTA